ncbi:Hpt domain-containing protein [Sulfurimonas sp.]|uniref:Hpt domain-containing protein n=1 Tax=Sulfurimonas sp. TaxID=2022749 RepID=UPI0035697549
MLIYNYQKEFVGIDESDLKALGFSDLSQLRSESADFADLFVKTPGFVHNFKHVHWIDFVTCAEGSEDSKVIIHANGKNFRCTLDIKTAYLVDDPSRRAYIINLVNLRALTHVENEQVAGDVLEKPAPRVSTQSSAIFNTPDFSSNFEDDKHDKVFTPEPLEEIEVTHDPYEESQTDTIDNLEINPKIVEDIYENAPIDLGDELLEIDDIQEDSEELHETEKETPEIEEVAKKASLPPIYTQVLNVGSDYVYDPHLASDELGLPVDLIEEFIQDFISQANEFKDDLYNSLYDGNTDNVKILSHKLKGVAANLRIEDAFEVLSTINTSDNTDEIKTNMDTLYIIIEKLSGKGVQPAALVEVLQSVEEEEISNENDDLILSFKDDDIEEQVIDDSEVPQKIEMPELADDDFLTIDDTQEEEIEEIVLNEEISEIDDLDKITLDDEIKELEPEQTTKETSFIQYDKAQAANEIGIDAQSFETLFDDFMIEGENACNEINSAIEQSNSDSWRQAAIKLKGMSDNMRIHDFTVELESIIHTQDSNEAKEALKAINTKLQQISSRKV